jgi:hypothetical protein
MAAFSLIVWGAALSVVAQGVTTRLRSAAATLSGAHRIGAVEVQYEARPAAQGAATRRGLVPGATGSWCIE